MTRSPPAEIVSNGRAHQHNAASRRWQCEQCPKAFKKREHLLRHVQAHTKRKPYTCGVCSKSYSRQDSLIRHSRSHSASSRHNKHNGPEEVVQSPVESSTDDQVDHDLSNIEDTVHPESGNLLLDTQSTYPEQSTNNLANFTQNNSSNYAFIRDTHHFPFTDNLIPDPPEACDLGSLYNQSNLYDPLWLLGGGFDLEALNYSTSISGPPQLQPVVALNSGDDVANSNIPTADGNSAAESPPKRTCQAVQNEWHTRPASEAEKMDHGVELASNQDKVDDAYRLGLSSRLRTISYDTGLPSADFLNMCIKLYFTKFHPIFPIIHAATFRPSATTSLLVLSICALGSTFVGSPTADKSSKALFLRLHKAILASWEKVLFRSGPEALALLQAVAIGQTAGLLSDTPKEMVTAASFHGTLIAWARQAGAFRCREAVPMSAGLEGQALEIAWRDWAQQEETIRVIHALHVHDAQFAALFHHEPFLRHAPRKLPAVSDTLFEAPTASHWKEQVEAKGLSTTDSSHHRTVTSRTIERDPRRKTTLSAYSALSGILATILEDHYPPPNVPDPEPFRTQLIQWYKTYLTPMRNSYFDTLCLRALWHKAFLALYINFDFLDRLVGRDGSLPDNTDITQITNWANDISGQLSVVHAMLIIDRMRTLRISAEPAIHVPAALFYAGCVIYCHIKYGRRPAVSWQLVANMPELQCITSSQSDTGGLGPGVDSLRELDASMLHEVVDLLRRQGHWGLSKRFATILELVVADLE